MPQLKIRSHEAGRRHDGSHLKKGVTEGAFDSVRSCEHQRNAHDNRRHGGKPEVGPDFEVG